MTPAEENAALVDLIRWIDTNFAGIELPTDERAQLAIGCFDVAVEHQAAIAVLFSAGLHGSMFALLRALTESLVRGLWLQHCAAELELAQFRKGRVDKDFGTLITEVETTIGATTPTLTNLKANAWKAMNGFAHTGFNQITRRYDAKGIVGANYPENEQSQAQALAGAIGLVAAAGLASFSGRSELLKAVMQRMREYATRRDSIRV